MKIDVDTKVILTKNDGTQTIVDDVSSITIALEIIGYSFTVFKTINEIVKKGW